jgi:[calcium/calmodulin-dependent protein kinase] kinase
MLGHPGVVTQVEATLLSDTTPDGATPPARSKASSLDADRPTTEPTSIEADGTIILSPSDEDDGYQGDIPDDDDSDSDEGLTMTRKKPGVNKDGEASSASLRSLENKRPVRKDTSTSIATITSIGSTETAKGSGFNA